MLLRTQSRAISQTICPKGNHEIRKLFHFSHKQLKQVLLEAIEYIWWSIYMLIAHFLLATLWALQKANISLLITQAQLASLCKHLYCSKLFFSITLHLKEHYFDNGYGLLPFIASPKRSVSVWQSRDLRVVHAPKWELFWVDASNL